MFLLARALSALALSACSSAFGTFSWDAGARGAAGALVSNEDSQQGEGEADEEEEEEEEEGIGDFVLEVL